ncbi:MAG TPA: hypothetical protein EYG89_04770 [Bacteroidia bacterium]|nr:hypothetical protein [Bacteroidia bacterium]
MKKTLLILLLSYTSLFSTEFTWQDKKVIKGTKINYINYDRPDYNEKNEYKSYSEDLSKSYKIQRKKESKLARR